MELVSVGPLGDKVGLLLSGVPQVARESVKNGDARFLSISCSRCNTEVVLDLQHNYGTPPRVKCSGCGETLVKPRRLGDYEINWMAMVRDLLTPGETRQSATRSNKPTKKRVTLC